MNIGLDFDGTFTADEPLWRNFIGDAQAVGHAVYIVTCRMDTDENREDVLGLDFGYTPPPSALVIRTGLPVWKHKFTSGSPKRWFLEQQGIHIWIDDMPECVEHGR